MLWIQDYFANLEIKHSLAHMIIDPCPHPKSGIKMFWCVGNSFYHCANYDIFVSVFTAIPLFEIHWSCCYIFNTWKEAIQNVCCILPWNCIAPRTVLAELVSLWKRTPSIPYNLAHTYKNNYPYLCYWGLFFVFAYAWLPLESRSNCDIFSNIQAKITIFEVRIQKKNYDWKSLQSLFQEKIDGDITMSWVKRNWI